MANTPLPQRLLNFLNPDGRTVSLPWYRWFQQFHDGSGGTEGPPGPAGPTGPQGPTGPAGAQNDILALLSVAQANAAANAPGIITSGGFPGTDGDPGDDGAPGPPGVAGATGATGPAGAAGPPGGVGPPGLDGEEGPEGVPVPGPIGPTGPSGTVEAGGRLTLTTLTPVLVTDVSGATTIYYTPYKTDKVPLWNGSTTVATAFSEVSQATTDSTKSPAACAAYSCYDIFAWNDSGTFRATRGPAWIQQQTFTVTIASPAVFSLTAHGFYEGQPLVFSTTGALPTGLTAGTVYFVIGAGLTANGFEVSTTLNGSAVNTSGSQSGTHTATQNLTVRGSGAGTTAISRNTDGYLTNTNAITNGPGAGLGTYVGTIRTNGSSTVDWICHPASLTSGGGSNALHVWNMYNRVKFVSENNDGASNWNYTLLTWRPRDGNTNAATTFVCGLQEDDVGLIAHAHGFNNGANQFGAAAVFDTFSGVSTSGINSTPGATGFAGGVANMAFPFVMTATGKFLGGHYGIQLEISIAAGTTNWIGTNGNNEKWCPSHLEFWG